MSNRYALGERVERGFFDAHVNVRRDRLRLFFLFLDELLDVRLLLGTALVVAGIVVVTLRYDAGVSRAASRAGP